MIVFQEGDVSAIIQMLPSFGKHAHAVMGYCYLFGVSPMHLKAKKLRLLLEELKRLFDGESFSFERRKYAISHAGIAEALDIMIKRDFAKPLSNHNYLKQVMITISEREGKAAGSQAEKGLRKKEAGLMSGSREKTTIHPYSRAEQDQTLRDHGYEAAGEGIVPPPVRMKSMPAAHLTDEQIAANQEHVKKLLGKIG